MKNNTKAFSIIEVMIWILIFTSWMISIYLVIDWSLNLVEDSKNKIIASNLAREDIEIIKNIRNTNFDSYRNWWYFDVWNDWTFENIFETEKNYILSNDNIVSNENYISNDINIKMEELTGVPEVSIENIKNGTIENINLKLIEWSYYSYSSYTNWEKTPFYKYTTITPIEYIKNNEDILNQKAVKVTTKVYWYYKDLKDVEVSTILTNWKNY